MKKEMKIKKEKTGCCEKRNNIKNEKKNKTFLQGIIFGTIPHIGCIAFIIGSILGVTVLTNIFKPFLLNRYFFYILIAISLGFATLSSIIYLKKTGFLSWNGIKVKWRYLGAMYSSTIGVNLLLFMVLFPLLANISSASTVSPTGAVIEESIATKEILKLKVDIPCPGHAPLISQELKKLAGVLNVKYTFPNIFEVYFDVEKINEKEILSLGVFKSYPATILEKTNSVGSQTSLSDNTLSPTQGGCCGGQGVGQRSCCGGAGSCGLQ